MSENTTISAKLASKGDKSAQSEFATSTPGLSKHEISIGEVTQTPIGPVWVAAKSHGLIAVDLHDSIQDFINCLRQKYPLYTMTHQSNFSPVRKNHPYVNQIVAVAIDQIYEYFNNKRQIFDLPIDWQIMTPFQQEVLTITYKIPYGEVTTYSEIARKTGNPNAARAVGRAQATNPLPIIIPCHRVIGADGKLHGYGGRGGIKTKAWLLRFEGLNLE